MARLPRPWQLAITPLVIGKSEWDVLADGLCQRTRVLEAVLADLLGPPATAEGTGFTSAVAERKPVLPARLPWFTVHRSSTRVDGHRLGSECRRIVVGNVGSHACPERSRVRA